jgi:RNA-directed DNA polymerase
MSDEVRESGWSKGGACSGAKSVRPTSNGRSLKDKAKPYCIARTEVLEAYYKVKSNKGAAGIDEQTIEDFERNLKRNLYKVWNRMSSGSYFPPPVRTVMIPKAKGGERALGIPTVADRVAQMVVKNRLEPLMDPLFHPNSFGYRPGKSALDAVGWARQRCWSFDWVCDLDIKHFFDNLDHDLLLKAVRKHAKEKWIVLYIERWLKAPAQDEEGNQTARERGTPQGGVISPLLANLFLHYTFDRWMLKKWKHLPFERYADDIIVHCRAEPGTCRSREAATRVWLGAAFGKDEARLLQGLESAGKSPAGEVRLFGLYVSAPEGEHSQRRAVLQLQSGHLERRGREDP